MAFAGRRRELNFQSYAELYQWSVTEIRTFWTLVWEYLDIRCSRPFEQAVDSPARMPGARWYTGARLNFAENLLRHRGESPADQRQNTRAIKRALRADGRHSRPAIRARAELDFGLQSPRSIAS